MFVSHFLHSQLYNDKKVNDRHYFAISGMGVDKEPKGVFSIEKKTGVVIVHKPIDREKYPFFHVSLGP